MALAIGMFCTQRPDQLQIEKENIEKIQAQEQKLAASKPYPQSCQFGKTYHYDLDGDGREEELCITYEENKENNV